MTTIAWLFIITAAVLVRQVSKGRGSDLPEDLKDFLLALLSGDTALMGEVAARTGEGTTATVVDVTGTSVDDMVKEVGAGSVNGVALLAEARKLGKAANNRYGWGSTGPLTYDCSGLVWRACKNIGVYTGIRFTTYTFRVQAKGWANEVSKPMVGDIVLWSGHMGIVSGANKMYSALSTKHGIIESSISTHRGTPSYWRIG